MGNGRHSGLPKGVKNITESLKGKLNNLVVHASTRGYRLGTRGIDTDERADAMNTYLSTLDQYIWAMGLPDLSSFVTGSLTIHDYGPYQWGVLGDADDSGNIRMSYARLADESAMLDTLPHEYTHQLVNYLITKELGYKQGSTEFRSAFYNGDEYRIINTAALQKWQDWMRSNGNSAIADKVKTPFDAARHTGMRDYATRVYGDQGAGIEIPTVAAENFVEARFSWDVLKQTHSYSWFVLKELQERLNKK